MPKTQKITLTGNQLSITDIKSLIEDEGTSVQLSSSALKRVQEARQFVEREMQTKVIYGVNTGFGPMASHIIGREQLTALQGNLIRSHAVGMGPELPEDMAFVAMVVRLNTLLKGGSGVTVELLKRIQQFVNHRIIPVIPEHGAVGTSGDLVQLAHIALAIIGEGEVIFEGKRSDTRDVLKKLRIRATYELQPKEGLSLINGTSAMTGIAALLCIDAERLISISTRGGAMALELVHGLDDSLSPQLHAVRPHPGQIAVARAIKDLLKDSSVLRERSEFQRRVKIENDVYEISESVQDVYSLRCIPQIVGPILETLENTKAVVEREMNSITDNPIIDLKTKQFLHGGNFHGDYVAHAMDTLKSSLVKLTILSERQINYFLNHNVNKTFPPFLNKHKPGLSLALQGLQFVATSTTARSQTLAFPQYVHSIPTNADNQDVVSMGVDAALLADTVVSHAYIVLTIELVVLAQAYDIARESKQLSQGTRLLYDEVRKILASIEEDREYYKELDTLTGRLRDDGIFTLPFKYNG